MKKIGEIGTAQADYDKAIQVTEIYELEKSR
jgi:hypothetical protein